MSLALIHRIWARSQPTGQLKQPCNTFYNCWRGRRPCYSGIVKKTRLLEGCQRISQWLLGAAAMKLASQSPTVQVFSVQESTPEIKWDEMCALWDGVGSVTGSVYSLPCIQRNTRTHCVCPLAWRGCSPAKDWRNLPQAQSWWVDECSHLQETSPAVKIRYEQIIFDSAPASKVNFD